MSNLTIQINSLEALERLIGGDTAAEVDIRNSVVQKFTEKHLKALAGQPNIQAIADSIGTATRASVEELLNARIGTITKNWRGIVDSVRLNASVVAEIDRAVKAVADKLIDQAVQSTFDKLKDGLEARISGAVKHRLDYEIANEVKKKVSEAFQAALLNVK
jgi:hypothetical protein